MGEYVFSGLFRKKPRIPKEVDVNRLNSTVISLVGKSDYPANCWNATQVFFGHSCVKFTSQPEMEEWLSKYTELDPMQLCTPGTIWVLRKQKELWHTAVYVGPGILWHKRGVSGHWEFMSPKSIRAIYFEADNFEFRILKP